jgi:hypothetical protein
MINMVSQDENPPAGGETDQQRQERQHLNDDHLAQMKMHA